MSQSDCIFCKIVAGAIPSTRVFEDEICVAFNDLSPQAPTHVLIVPREHFDSLDKAEAAHKATLGHLLLTAAKLARDTGFADGFSSSCSPARRPAVRFSARLRHLTASFY
jgi:histidine triad (HIT) family protein